MVGVDKTLTLENQGDGGQRSPRTVQRTEKRNKRKERAINEFMVYQTPTAIYSSNHHQTLPTQ